MSLHVAQHGPRLLPIRSITVLRASFTRHPPDPMSTPTDPSRRWTAIPAGGDVAPPAGAYSPGVRAGPFLFISGQVPKDPHTGEMVSGNVADETRQVLRNLVAVLEAGGARAADVVSVSVFLSDESHWPVFNTIYQEFFEAPYPTRAVIGARLRGIQVEVSAVAYLGG